VTVAEPDYLYRLAVEEEPNSDEPGPGVRGLPGSGTDPLFDDQWHLQAINAPAAWAHLEGLALPPGGSSDVVVAIIDTGVDYTHPNLAPNMWVNS